MAHHKRRGPKATRNGCLLCKPHKHQGANMAARQSHGVNKKLVGDDGRLRPRRHPTQAAPEFQGEALPIERHNP